MLRRILSFSLALSLALGGLGGLALAVAPHAGAEVLATGVWLPKAPLVNGGYETKAARLNDGRVLAIGWSGQASVYDPAADSWSAAGSVWYPLQPVVLADGRALVAGGVPRGGNMFTNRASLFDPASNTWSPAADMPFAAHGQEAVRLADGRVLFAGGLVQSGGYWVDAPSDLIYDPASNSWRTVPSTSPQRTDHTLTLLKDGTVLMAAGYHYSQSASATTAAVFDPTTERWTAVGSPATAHMAPTASRLADGRVLLVGGGVPDVFDPATRTWAPTAPMSTPRYHQGAAVLPDGRVLITGGEGARTSTELYDPATNAWTPSAPMNQERSDFGVVALADGRVLAAGGAPQPSEVFTFEDLGHPAVLAAAMDPASKRYTATAELSAIVRPSGSPIVAAEWSRDQWTAPGSGTPMALSDWYGYTKATATIGADLPPGGYAAVVRALDASGVWAQRTVSFEILANQPPQVSLGNLYKEVSEPAVLQAGVWDDHGVAAAEFFIGTDPGPGAGRPMTLTLANSGFVLSAQIADDLAVGAYTIGVRALDDDGAWSSPRTASLYVWRDTQGPYVSPISVFEGGFNQPSRFQAFTWDADVAAAEFYVDADPGLGQGSAVAVVDEGNGRWRLSGEAGTDVPAGFHTLFVRAVDRRGNWGSASSASFNVYKDLEAPRIGWASASPSPKWVGETGMLQAGVSDNFGLRGGEWFTGADPGLGKGTPMEIYWNGSETVARARLGTDLPVGDLVLWVRVVDMAGNWSAPVAVPLTVWQDTTPPTVSGAAVSPGVIAAGESATLNATATDDRAVAGGEYSVDGGAPVAMTVTGTSLTAPVGPGLSAGEHVVSVRAVDTSGNWSTATTAKLVVFDPAAGGVFGGGWLDASAASDGARSSFKIDAGYDGAGDRTADGRLEIHTGTVDLKANAFSWIAVSPGAGTFSGVATAPGKNGEVWTIRFSGTTGSLSTLSFQVSLAGATTPQVSVSGPVKGAFSTRPATR